MTRNLKAMGLALVAVFALGAISASSAMAEETKPIAHFTASEYPAKVTGSQIGKAILVVGSLGESTCNKAHFHGELTKAATSLTGTGTLEECEMHTFLGQHRPVTVTTNGCTGTLTVHEKGTTDEDVTVETPDGTIHKHATIHRWSGDSRLDCPEGVNGVETHAYKSGNTAHTELLCTYTLKPQTVKNIHFSVITVGGKSTYMTVEAKEAESKITRTSGTVLNCGGAEQTGKYTGVGTVEALNEEGAMIEGGIDTVTT